MRLDVPESTDPQVRVTVRSNDWSTVMTVDRSHRTIDVDLPNGVSEDDVESFAEFIEPDGQVNTTRGAVVLKTKRRKRKSKDR